MESLPGRCRRCGSATRLGRIRPAAKLSLLALVAAATIAAVVPLGHTQTPASSPSQATYQQQKAARVTLYAGLGPELSQYDVDIDNATLTKRSTRTLPGNVQYAWPHPSRKYLYVAWSTGGPPTPGVNSAGGHHGLSAFRVDPDSGALTPLGQPAVLASRPIHVSVDISGTHVLVAYNDPSGVTVHQIQPDGSVGPQVNEPAGLDVGIYAHQIRVDSSNKMAILVTRGNGPTGNKPEDPGALKVFGYAGGVLTNRASIAPNRGINFQPRHLDFHPSRPWVFVSLERQSKLEVYGKKDGTLSSQPLFVKDTVADPKHMHPGQEAGTLHMHPNGKIIYIANRASGTADAQGMAVFSGGENSIAVFAINQETGEPTRVQGIDTHGMTPRTFALDPSARILVVGNQLPLVSREGDKTVTQPPNLAVFRIREDGKLEFVRKYDVPAPGGRMLFWMGLVPLP